MKKKTVTAWIPKGLSIAECIEVHPAWDRITMVDSYAKKATVKEWGKENWPPVKIRITVEVVE